MPRDSAAKSDRRTNSVLRQMAQDTFQELPGLFEELGDERIAIRLRELRTVESVMREEPLLVPMLLSSVWKLKDHPALAGRFIEEGSDAVVTDKVTALGPCGRSFEDVERSHLLGTARLFFRRCARDWAVRETARQSRLYEAKIKRQPIKNAWRTLRQSHPTFSMASVEPDYPGHGLYEAVKTHLLDQRQFKLLPVMSTLSAAHVMALGEAVRGISDPNVLEGLRSYEPGEVAALNKYAHTFADTVLWHQGVCAEYLKPPCGRSPLYTGDNRTETLAGEVLSHLVLKHRLRIAEVLAQGEVANDVIKKLAPAMGHELWSVFESKECVANIVAVPETVAEGLGDFARFIPPVLSEVISGFASLALCRDLILLAVERHGEEMVQEWLEHPGYLDLWRNVAETFDDSYKYSRDHQGDEFKNWADLKQKAVHVFEPFCRPIHKHKELLGAA